MDRIKRDVEFTTTQGTTEKVNLHILDLMDMSKAVKLRKSLLAKMDSADAKSGDDAYELAHKEAVVFLACHKADGSLYFSSIEEMQKKLTDTALYVLHNTYLMHKQSNDGMIYALGDTMFEEICEDIKERGEQEISPFWFLMLPQTQYDFVRTLVDTLHLSLQENFSGISQPSDTSATTTPDGSELPSG